MNTSWRKVLYRHFRAMVRSKQTGYNGKAWSSRWTLLDTKMEQTDRRLYQLRCGIVAFRECAHWTALDASICQQGQMGTHPTANARLTSSTATARSPYRDTVALANWTSSRHRSWICVSLLPQLGSPVQLSVCNK